MFTFAYNTNGLRKMPFSQAVKRLAQIGYEGIEISLQSEHFTCQDVSLSDLAAIKKLLKENNIEVSCIATGDKQLLSLDDFEPSLICGSETGRRQRIDCIMDACDVASELDCPVVNFASGYKTEDEDFSRKCLLEGITELADYAKEVGVIIAIEPEPGMYIDTTKKAAELIKTLKKENFLMNLDIGHVECCENNFLNSVEQALEFTAHIHIEDIKNKVHHHEIPGAGDIDFKRVFQIINRSGYDKAISVELYDHADEAENAMKESFDYLTSILKNL